MATVRASGHGRSKGRIDERLNGGNCAKARGEVKEFRATSDQALLDLLIKSNVGAAEAVDRLLWIADQEQLSGNRLNLSPIGFGGIIGSEKQQDLGLEWIGILELVDKVVREALLQLGPYALVVTNEITRLDQEIEEIEAPGLRSSSLDRRSPPPAALRGAMAQDRRRLRR